jgi:alcohol dehydrogenase (cytochrome c)
MTGKWKRPESRPTLGFIFLLLLTGPAAHAQDLQQGLSLFNATCAHCHGGNGQGGTLGPNILPRVLQDDDAALANLLQVGNPTRGMPGGLVSASEMPHMLGFLRELASSFNNPTFSSAGSAGSRTLELHSANFVPVTEAMLLDPDPADWLWFSRTPDAQRFSPLDQINRNNVSLLGLAWARGLPTGNSSTIPTVYKGVMYLTLPGSNIVAMDATNGDVIWEYTRDYVNPSAGGSGRSKTLAIYDDMIYFTAPDETIVALDARSGAVRWEAPVSGRGNTTGAIVVKGKVLSSGTCATGRATRENCNITAHDAHTGELAWMFYLTQASDDPGPGFDTWFGVPDERRRASSWGLPGSYDAESGLLYWSVANPDPYTRLERHGGHDAVPFTAPVDLYSNSTLAINPDTGELVWYYQHLPGDDWDADMNEERIIIRTKVNPDPQYVKWINPDIPKGEVRDIVVNVGEGGGLWALDKFTGQFLWATPFPEESENFVISDIDLRTGATMINPAILLDRPGAHRIICYFNTRSYWPNAYSPRSNAMYVSYIKNCLNMTAASPATETMPATRESRIGIIKPGTPLEELNGVAKVNMETGEITLWPSGSIPATSAILATAGDLIFQGDINRRFRALDADSGELLWQTVLGGPISMSNISYAVDGKQYIAVIAGDNLAQPGLNTGTFGPIRLDIRNSYRNNTLYVFALP